jgi:fused signal recognition particle receptor
LMQAKSFVSKVGVTGLILTKLDSSAKGGVVFAIAEELKLPIKLVGTGERIDDLQPFDAGEFVRALFA